MNSFVNCPRCDGTGSVEMPEELQNPYTGHSSTCQRCQGRKSLRITKAMYPKIGRKYLMHPRHHMTGVRTATNIYVVTQVVADHVMYFYPLSAGFFNRDAAIRIVHLFDWIDFAPEEVK